MSELSDLLPASAVELDLDVRGWEQAVRSAGTLLAQSGACGPDYIDAMIQTAHKHRSSLVIAPGFALAHARPNSSVLRTGMSFVRLAEPVCFGHPSHDPVRIVMGLASTKDISHQAALVSLAGVLIDPDSRTALDAAQNAEQVLAALQ